LPPGRPGNERLVIAEAARVQAVLEGVPLPATTRQLVAYAAAQPEGSDVAGLLRALGEREFESLDAVGEALAPVQPDRAGRRRGPRAESGSPPGGEDYTRPSPTPGAVRAD
jgi:hypothetical protein